MTTTLHTQPATTSQSDTRGFALYVGITEDQLATDIRLGDVVSQIRALIAQLAPEAQTHATVALAPQGAGGNDLNIVRLALGDPSLPRQTDHSDEDLDRPQPHVTIDLSRKQVLLDSYPANLTFREFELLQFFILREGLAVSREEIINTLWARTPDHEKPSDRTIDVQIRRLRVKLGDYQDIIRTVRGLGYRFDLHADVRIIHPHAQSPDRF